MFVSALDYECKARKGNGGKKQIVGIVFLRLDYDKPLQGRGSIFSLLKRGWVGGKLDQRIKRKKTTIQSCKTAIQSLDLWILRTSSLQSTIHIFTDRI